jgi:UDP-N-acetylglucosamine--N-acetylmuramyl-(pentapeptide) pyrophosphoryl-undecaprenol N-acetylglucosamine transferase
VRPKVCFCGGGTGGHLVPNFALHLEFSSRGWDSFFLVPNNPFDLEFCRRKSLNYDLFSGSHFYRIRSLRAVLSLLYAVWETFSVFRKKKPKFVIGTGGYGAFPVYLYCLLASVPFYIVEPNLVAGKVNRWFGDFASLQFTCHTEVAGIPASKKVCNLGNPLPYEVPSMNSSGNSLLVFGASQGASSINHFILDFLTRYGADLPVPVTWILGLGRKQELENLKGWQGVTILEYSDDMEELYLKAGLVLARAGAGTVAEIQYFRVPAIFVPFPFHRDRQQYENCSELVEAGACILWEDDQLGEGSHAETLFSLLSQPLQRREMRAKFPSTNKFLARQEIVDTILQEQKIF